MRELVRRRAVTVASFLVGQKPRVKGLCIIIHGSDVTPQGL